MEVTTVFEQAASVSVQFGMKLHIAMLWYVKVASWSVFADFHSRYGGSL